MLSNRIEAAKQFSSLDRAHWTVDDWKALTALAILFFVMIGASWQRWTQPIIDHGREMNVPARILAGEQLYVDIQFLYGPFAPYFNAFLYRVFGIRLSVLHVAGAVCAWTILLTIYWLARQLMGVREAALTSALVLVICAVKFSASYIFPYAFAALYGLVFAVVSLSLTVRYWRDEEPRWLLWSGILAGLTVISKWEISLAAISTAFLSIALSSYTARKIRWKDALRFVVPVILITSTALALVLSRVPWRTLVDDNHILFSKMPAQLVYFNSLISGLGNLPHAWWYTASGLGMFALWAGLIVMIGAISVRKTETEWWSLARAGAWITASGLIWWAVVRAVFKVRGDANVLTAMPILLPFLILALGWRVLKLKAQVSKEVGLLLLIAVFAQISILRVILNVKVTSPYVPFFIPITVVVAAFLLLSFLPAVVALEGRLREAVRRASAIIVSLLVIGMAVGSITRYQRHNTFEVTSARGEFKTRAEIGVPMAAAIEYVKEHTSPDDLVLTLPQGTSINFLTERRYPFREEIVHPGFLSDEEAIRRLQEKRVRLILVVNLLTPEFEDRVFGADYFTEFWGWINSNYHQVARFESANSRGAHLGDQPFFILAFERNN